MIPALSTCPIRLKKQMHHLKSLFLLDPTITFLNHGSFGATPRPVFEAYQAWQRRMEAQPVKFLGRELLDHLAAARQALGSYLNTAADNLVYIPNTTYGINVIARSLNLGPGDEVLTTNHEYGACDKTWSYWSQKRGFAYRQQPIAYPFPTHEAMVEALWQGVTDQTRVIFISHISSATAVLFPVQEICRRAREAGILTVVDGAHAPGQIDLDLSAIDADWYCGNLHKWLSAPKGAAFIYTRPDKQPLVEPFVVSWGWGEPKGHTSGSDYVDRLEYTGTDDYSAYLSVPAAIQFQAEQEWTAVRAHCHQQLRQAVAQASQLTHCPTPYPDDTYYAQMAIVPLPPIHELGQLKQALYNQFRVEIPCITWAGHSFIRISFQGYNSLEDVAVLLAALEQLLPIYAD